MANWYRWQDKLLHIHIYLQPRASRNQIVGVHEDCLKIRLTAPPIDDRANDALLTFLAECFKVPTSRVQLIKGDRGRKKWVQIDSPTVLDILNQHDK